MTWVVALSWLGTVLAISGTAMKTIIPLRCVGIAGNLVALVCSTAAMNVPGIVANLILLPVNSLRLVQMVRLVARVKQAARSDLSMEWLKPYMSRRAVTAGAVLFAKGDTAECMYYTLSGRFRLKESGLVLANGQVVGEMGFLAPENRRTQTLECVEGGEVLTIRYDDLRQLYFQNPEFGFYFLRLISERLFQNVGALETEVAHLRAEAARLDRAA
jgi:CRP/FNR family transcriptional regulator, cyclic AMP receptor protein